MWKDIVTLYESDFGEQDLKMLPRLTNAHVYSAHIKKMKVRNAAQIFSKRVSAV